jgi:hypothetical protein
MDRLTVEVSKNILFELARRSIALAPPGMRSARADGVESRRRG